MLERGSLCDMGLLWSLSTSSNSRRRRRSRRSSSSVAITPLCHLMSSQCAGRGWKLGWVQEWFWVGSCSNKVHGRLPDCCNPTSTWPADQRFSPESCQRDTPSLPAATHLIKKQLWCTLRMFVTGSSQLTSEVHTRRRGGQWTGLLGGVFVCIPGVHCLVLH